MKQFCFTLGKVIKRPSWTFVPSFVLKLILGEMSSMLLEGQKVVPEKLNVAGYKYRYPELKEAFIDIFTK
jgi:hypothetical protein